MKIGGNTPQVQHNPGHHTVQQVDNNNKPVGAPITPTDNGAALQLQGMTGQGPVVQGSIPGAQGTSGAMLGAVSNPSALFQVNAQAATGQQMQALGQAGLQMMNALGLGHLPQAQQFAFMSQVGQSMTQQAMAMAPAAMAKDIMTSLSSMVNGAAGQFAINRGFNQAMTEQMGGQFLNGFNAQPTHHWGRQVLGNIGPQHFNQFDPAALAQMPNRALTPFGNQIASNILGQAPFQLGQNLLGGVTPGMQQAVGQNLFNNLNPATLNQLGPMMQQQMMGNPAQLGQSLLGNLGNAALKQIGANVFPQAPGLTAPMPGGVPGMPGAPGLPKGGVGDLVKKFIGDLKAKGTDFFKNNIMGGVKKFFNDKILNPVQGKLTQWGQGLLDKIGSPMLKKAGGKLLDFVKGSKLGQLGGKFLDKIGGKVLDKLGGFGKIASGALSLLNGKLDTKKILQMGMNFIPVVGPALSALSAIPGVGKIFDKVLGGVAKVIDKLPIVGKVFKGIGKLGGAIGKGVGKLVGGVKKIGGKLLGGVKKIGGKIASGVKKVFKGW